MKNNYTLAIAGCIALIVLGAVTSFFWNFNSTEYNQEEIRPTATPPAFGMKSYSNPQYGISFQYSDDFDATLSGISPILILRSPKDTPSDSPAQNTIELSVFPANGADSFDDYVSKNPILNPNNEKPYAFQARKIGGSTFYFTQIERFEGVYSVGYYIFANKTLFAFTSISRGVDWTNQNFDGENDSTHLALKKLLGSVNFSPIAEGTAGTFETYQNPEVGYSISYPSGYQVEENIKISERDKVNGTKFHFPTSYTAGTNLSDDSFIAVEEKFQNSCAPVEFLGDEAHTNPITERPDFVAGNTTWKVGVIADAGAGNFYAETEYTSLQNGICYGIHLFLHSLNIGAMPDGTKAFDPNAIGVIGKQMVSSFKLLN